MNLNNILTERAEAYGDPRDMHELIGDYWTAYLGQTITASDVAQLMVLFKIARASYGDNEKTADDLLDAQGYLHFAAEFKKEDGQTQREQTASEHKTKEEQTFEKYRSKVKAKDLIVGKIVPEPGLEADSEEKIFEVEFPTKNVNQEVLNMFCNLDSPSKSSPYRLSIHNVPPTDSEFAKMCGQEPVENYQAFMDDIFERGTTQP